MVDRLITQEYLSSLREFPATGLVGPRQVGKTTFVRQIMRKEGMLYLDLEKNSDLNKLTDPELYLSQHQENTVILDEIQHLPELFPLLRALIDEDRRPGRFVILGSASPSLLRQSSESLAGRINYLEMFPLNLPETNGLISWQNLWIRGGFPKPALSDRASFSRQWYRNFVQSYVQRDLPAYGLPAEPRVTRLLLQMIASSHGNLLNYSNYAKSLGITMPTVKTYLDFLDSAFLIKLLQPWYVNLKKRIVKSPKIYIRDSGMLHYLAGISTYDDLMGNILAGNSWEGFVITQIASILRSDDEMYFYRTQDGSEIDLLVRRNNTWLFAAAIKLTNSPILTKGTYLAMDDLGIDRLHVITPGSDTYPISENVEVTNLERFLNAFK